MSPVAFSRGRTSLLTMPLGGATAEMKASTSARWRLTSNPSLKKNAEVNCGSFGKIRSLVTMSVSGPARKGATITSMPASTVAVIAVKSPALKTIV